MGGQSVVYVSDHWRKKCDRSTPAIIFTSAIKNCNKIMWKNMTSLYLRHVASFQSLQQAFELPTSCEWKEKRNVSEIIIRINPRGSAQEVFPETCVLQSTFNLLLVPVFWEDHDKRQQNVEVSVTTCTHFFCFWILCKSVSCWESRPLSTSSSPNRSLCM